MRRVVSLFLPHLAIERLRRLERPAPRPPEAPARLLPVDDDPGACSVPRGGGWRPGARCARAGTPTHPAVEHEIAALPAHARPPMRELGRRSEWAAHPFKRPASAVHQDAVRSNGTARHAPLALIDKVGRREEVVAACSEAVALGIHVGMAATHARALVSDLDFRPAERQADAALLERLTLLAVRRWTPIAAVTPPDGLWLDLKGCDHLHGGEGRFCRCLQAFCQRAGFTARIALADTPGAAHAIARFGTLDISIVPAGKGVDALSLLTMAALRLSDSALSAACRFGFERIADIVPVARGPLAPPRTARDHPPRPSDRGDRQPISPAEDPSVPMVARRLLEPIGTAEAIAQVMADLLDDLAELLRAKSRSWSIDTTALPLHEVAAHRSAMRGATFSLPSCRNVTKSIFPAAS